MRRFALTGFMAWGLAVLGGFAALEIHEATPGSPGRYVEQWPSGSAIHRATDRLTLVMAAHPRCPCTNASVAELARVLARCEGRISVVVLVYGPEDAVGAWDPPAWAGKLSAIPGVRLIDDPGGRESARFGAKTSGQVSLYNPDGRLLYRGGVTGSRGHEGRNLGAEAIVTLANGGTLPYPESLPAFGCSLF